jgi:hypothetical protein
MKAYFQNIESVIAEQLQSAQKSIRVAVCWFVNDRLFQILLQKQREGVSVSLIIDYNDINFNSNGLNFQELKNVGANVYVMMEGKNIMHHKFCVIDQVKVITGSYNWTYKAENINFENIVILEGQEMAYHFLDVYFYLSELCTSEIPEKITNVNLSEEILTELHFQEQYQISPDEVFEEDNVTELNSNIGEPGIIASETFQENEYENLSDLFRKTKIKLINLFNFLESIETNYTFLIPDDFLDKIDKLNPIKDQNNETDSVFNNSAKNRINLIKVKQLERHYLGVCTLGEFKDLDFFYDLLSEYRNSLNELISSKYFFFKGEIVWKCFEIFKIDCAFPILCNPDVLHAHKYQRIILTDLLKNIEIDLSFLIEELLNRNGIPFKRFDGLTQNPALFEYPEIITEYCCKNWWNWDDFLKNPALLEHPLIIDKYISNKNWNWKSFSANPALVDYPELIKKYSIINGWNWEAFAKNPALLDHRELLIEYSKEVGWSWGSFLKNPLLPKYSDLIETYSNKFTGFWDCLLENPTTIYYPEILYKYYNRFKNPNKDKIIELLKCGGIVLKKSLKNNREKIKLYPIQMQPYLENMFK